MHPLYDVLPVPYVPVNVTRSPVIPHQYTYEPPRCRTSQYRIILIPLSVYLWNDIGDPVLDDVGLAGFKSRANAFLFAQLLAPFCLLQFSLSLISFNGLVLWGWGPQTDIALSQPCTANLF